MADYEDSLVVPTRVEPAARELAATRIDAGGAGDVHTGTLLRLPSGLATRFIIRRQLPVLAGQADVLVVEALEGGETQVLKLYRVGCSPKEEVLARVQRAPSEHVVRLLEFGQDEGHWFELQEFVVHGSLRDLIENSGPRVEGGLVRSILVELTTALPCLHQVDLIHRDLKPENILVRTLEPLDLVLTDFGIASVATATQHVTSADRTVRYAAPEQSSGVISSAIDYWSLGIMVAEMLSGAHPFANMSDQVILAHLATLPVPLEGIAEPWRTLCRGLLARDPQVRWGEAEVARWLAGDRSLVAPADEGTPARRSEGVAVEPFHFLNDTYNTPTALAAALAANWDEGAKQLARGYLGEWVQRDLHNQSLKSFLDDLLQDQAMELDAKLFRVLRKFAPRMAPSYKGYALDETSLSVLATQALGGNARTKELIQQIYTGRLLSAAGDEASGWGAEGLEARWREEYSAFCKVLEQQDKDAGASAGADSADGYAPLLLALLSDKFEASLRLSATELTKGLAGECVWYCALAEDAHRRPAVSLALQALKEVALVEVQREREAQQARDERAMREAEAERMRDVELRARHAEGVRQVHAQVQAIRELECGFGPFSKWKRDTLSEWAQSLDTDTGIGRWLERGEASPTDVSSVTFETARAERLLVKLQQERQEINDGLLASIERHVADVGPVVREANAVAAWVRRHPPLIVFMRASVRRWLLLTLIPIGLTMFPITVFGLWPKVIGGFLVSLLFWAFLGAGVGALGALKDWMRVRGYHRSEQPPAHNAAEVKGQLRSWVETMDELRSFADALLSGAALARAGASISEGRRKAGEAEGVLV